LSRSACPARGLKRLGSLLLSWVGLGLGLGALGPGCKTPHASSPLPTGQRYLELVAEGRLDAAYALLDESYRKKCDRTCFKRLAGEQRAEARRALDELRRGGTRVEESAALALPDGTALHLGRVLGEPEAPRGSEPASFVLQRNPLDFYPQSTPEETVRSFVRAVKARRYEVLVRFVPRGLSADLTAAQIQARFEGEGQAALARQLEALTRHWDEPFLVDEKSARLPVGDGQEVRLVLEEGRWRIVQLN
jgi:hypothetical protein